MFTDEKACDSWKRTVTNQECYFSKRAKTPCVPGSRRAAGDWMLKTAHVVAYRPMTSRQYKVGKGLFAGFLPQACVLSFSLWFKKAIFLRHALEVFWCSTIPRLTAPPPRRQRPFDVLESTNFGKLKRLCSGHSPQVGVVGYHWSKKYSSRCRTYRNK